MMQQQQRKVSKETPAAVVVVDPIKEREKRAFKAGARDINSNNNQAQKGKAKKPVSNIEEEFIAFCSSLDFS